MKSDYVGNVLKLCWSFNKLSKQYIDSIFPQIIQIFLNKDKYQVLSILLKGVAINDNEFELIEKLVSPIHNHLGNIYCFN